MGSEARLGALVMPIGNSLFGAVRRRGRAADSSTPPPRPTSAAATTSARDGLAETRGHPKLVDSTKASKDEDAARRLWDVSEELTGVRYDAVAS